MIEKNRYNLIYNYLLTRIHYGFYRKGEYLPSIDRLSSLFGVSTMVIRSTFTLLRKNGYLSAEGNGRSAVLYDSVSPDQEFPDLILMQKNDFKDLHQGFGLVFPSIFFAGLSMCDGQDLANLHKILDTPMHAWDVPIIEFLAYLANRLNNALLADLYYDAILFCYPTYLDHLAKDHVCWEPRREALHRDLLEILTLKERDDTEALWNMACQSCSCFSPRPLSTAQEKQKTTYQWGKSHVCLSAASELVSRIYSGEYPVGAYLPSARILSEELSVAIITMRRSIVLLNDLGVVESVNGKGTKVIPPEYGLQKIKWDDPAIRKNIMLYLESLYILVITCRLLATTLFPLIPPEEKARLRDQISLIKGEAHAGQANAFCLHALVSAARLSSLEAIYDKLFSFLVWGQPLSYLEPYLQLDRQTDLLAASLNVNDAAGFGRALEQAYIATFLSSQEKVIGLGIEEAKRLVLPFFED